MTLGKAAVGVVHAGGGTYNIGFNDGDETQFSVYNLQELLECWIEFCAENGFQTNSVDYVERVWERFSPDAGIMTRHWTGCGPTLILSQD